MKTIKISDEKTVENFKKDIVKLSQAYGLSISHQDSQGAFEIEQFDTRNIDWFMQANNKTNLIKPNNR